MLVIERKDVVIPYVVPLARVVGLAAKIFEKLIRILH